MGTILGDILTLGIGVAISPVPIIAVILMLFGKRARSTGPAFLLGWILALSLEGAVVLLLSNAGRISAGGTPSTISYLLKFLLGVLLLFLSLRQWRGRLIFPRFHGQGIKRRQSVYGRVAHEPPG